MKSKLSSSFYMSHSSNAFLLFLYSIKLYKLLHLLLWYQLNWFKSMDNQKHCDAICEKMRQNEPTFCYEFERSSGN